jgi:phosphoserine phosphatase
MVSITRAAMAGGIPFPEALRERVTLLQGTPVPLLREVAASIPLTPGARDLVAVLRNLGYRLAAVSGGFDTVVGPLAEDLGLDSFHANRLEIRDGVLTGGVEGDILDGAGKARVLREICARERIATDQAVAVGDGANDVEMLAAAGLGIAFRGVERLRTSAGGSIRRNDLRSLLYFLGVSQRDLRDLRGDLRRGFRGEGRTGEGQSA